MNPRASLAILSCLLAATLAAGCGGGGGGSALPPSGGGGGSGAPPPPPQTSCQYLYVAHNYTVDIYALPLTSSSTPAFSISNLNNAVGLAFDANGNLYVTQIGGNASSLPGNSVAIFAPPFSASSTPAAVITNGLSAPRAVAVDASGNLYVGNGNDVIDVFTPPLSASSAPAVTLTVSGSTPEGLAIR